MAFDLSLIYKKDLPALLGALRDMRREHKQVLLLLIDVIVVFMAFGVVLFLDPTVGRVWQPTLEQLGVLTLLTCSAAVGSGLLGLHKVQLKSYEARGMARSAILGGIIGFMAWIANFILTPLFSGSAIVLLTTLFVIGSVLARFMLLQIVRQLYSYGGPVTKVLIYGAGMTGMQLALALRASDSMRVVGFLDDNSAMNGLSVAGLTVHQPTQISKVASLHGVSRVLLAMPSVSQPKLTRIARRLTDMGFEVQSLPSFAQLVGVETLVDALKQALPDSFLSREAVDANMLGACGVYEGKSVMVSGAGGSIGSELCRQLLLCKPRRLVLLESNEHALYQINDELIELGQKSDCEIVPILGTVTERRLVQIALVTHDVQVVLHAAAYKHVPMVEANVLAGIVNNIFGTAILAREAADAGVERFVLVSTDKAVRPKGVMGATKRMAELVVADCARRQRLDGDNRGTVFCMVRFGNVLGSSGSVIPRFQEQIATGGPITLTHPDIQRFFMTIQEATQLVLRAGAMATGGDAFVLDMGKPVRIADLAKMMVESAGLTVRDARNPDGDIEIMVTKLRPGEKLYEELSITNEQSSTDHPKIFVAKESGLSEFQITRALAGLRRAIASGDPDIARKELLHWVRQDLDALRALRVEEPIAAISPPGAFWTD
ncbi:MAG: polysaccharide biosynthesis protein [Rhodobacteraceae bacterium]|nr:polysaccharide biosynthesis protein [Paracoccaceae bacterium]